MHLVYNNQRHRPSTAKKITITLKFFASSAQILEAQTELQQHRHNQLALQLLQLNGEK